MNSCNTYFDIQNFKKYSVCNKNWEKARLVMMGGIKLIIIIKKLVKIRLVKIRLAMIKLIKRGIIKNV